MARLVRSVVVLLDVAVALQEVNNWKIRRGLAIGHRGTLQHPPAGGAVRVHTLIHQARLPYARFPHQGHHLAVPCLGLCQGLMEHGQLVVSPHEGSEAARHCRLQALPERAGPHQLEDLYRLRQALDRERSEGGDLDEPLHQPQRLDRQPDAPGRSQLFHARCGSEI